MYTCPICGEKFDPYEGMRASANTKFWCKKDQDEFDSIDWDEVYEKQREESGY